MIELYPQPLVLFWGVINFCCLQVAHNEELESLREEHVQQMKHLRDKMVYEESRRKKLQDDLQMMKSMNDHNLSTLKESHEELIRHMRDNFTREIDTLKSAHEQELHEEKEATRRALDAVQRAHESELKEQLEKVRSSTSDVRECMTKSPQDGHDQLNRKQNQMLEQMSRELSELSSAYSAKCLENSLLDEKLAEVMSAVAD
uniref:Uncharacterized protein n=1 Tax=Plectus sambesii TaxID=2011161 RepID=A0A914V704_9BILA